MTCRLGDKLVNSILGRPATTIGIIEELNPIFTTLASSDDHSLQCMIGAYKIVAIIDEINTKLYGEQNVRARVIERLLQAIETWKCETLPSLQHTIPQRTIPSRDATARNTSVGVVHVSCLYYFAVMLVTRPIYISALTLNLGDSDRESPMRDACLEAATLLAQTCIEALDDDRLESNMCIMKYVRSLSIFVLGTNILIERSFSLRDLSLESRVLLRLTSKSRLNKRLKVPNEFLPSLPSAVRRRAIILTFLALCPTRSLRSALAQSQPALIATSQDCFL